MTDTPLSGHTVVVTRDEPGELGERLAGLGAAVVHVPLIEITDPDDGGAALRDATARLGRYDWLIVTSPNGARRVAAASTGVAAWPRAAAVGRSTAATFQALTGRDAELVPEVQRLDGLLDVFPRGDGRVLAARGDLADPALVGGLRELGWTVDDVVAYRTRTRPPTDDGRARIRQADVVTFASGSAAVGWVDAFGPGSTAELGIAVVAIGPSTAEAAGDAGLEVTAVAEHHSVEGLVDAVVVACADPT